LAQFYVLRRVYEQGFVEGGFADFVIARASDYLLPIGLQAHNLEGQLTVLDHSVMRTEREQAVKVNAVSCGRYTPLPR
jgi:hypothetical protein